MEVLDHFQKKGNMKKNNKFEFSLQFRPGIEYLIVAQLETSGGVSSEAKGVTVKSMAIGEAIKVRVKGPREVYADRMYKYIASPILCSETETIEDLNLKVVFFGVESARKRVDEREGE